MKTFAEIAASMPTEGLRYIASFVGDLFIPVPTDLRVDPDTGVVNASHLARLEASRRSRAIFMETARLELEYRARRNLEGI